MILVEAPGALATLQDQGRTGMSGIGVGRSGAFDMHALDLANRLVGNASTAAAIEAVGSGLRLRAQRDIWVAVTGAPGGLRAAGRPAPRNTALRLRTGELLELPTLTAGLRSYVAVRGGFAPTPVLGSRSWDSLGKLGPPPLGVGDLLPVGPATNPVPPVDHAPTGGRGDVGTALSVTPGPRRDWFTEQAWHQLMLADLLVLPTSDRVGIRLSGTVVARTRERQGAELPPEGLVRGAVQIPPDGHPIIMGPDHPTTGGYPVIAVVHPPDLDRCAQLVPGETVRLRAILFAGR